MDIFETMRQRRSSRKFTQAPVSQEDLLTIAQAARLTATSSNQQSRRFTIVHKQATIQKFEKALASYGYGLYAPQALLLISSPRHNTYSQIETGLAVQNAYLAATALGLATVWTDQIRNRCDEVAIRKLLTEIKIPTDHICWTILPIGVAAENPASKERREEIIYIAD